jgi:hypothetical protein
MTSAPSEAEEQPEDAFRRDAIPSLRGTIQKDNKIKKSFELQKVGFF